MSVPAMPVSVRPQREAESSTGAAGPFGNVAIATGLSIVPVIVMLGLFIDKGAGEAPAPVAPAASEQPAGGVDAAPLRLKPI